MKLYYNPYSPKIFIGKFMVVMDGTREDTIFWYIEFLVSILNGLRSEGHINSL